jgi:hypothetical protein
MATGLLMGPASTFPTLRTSASICFSDRNDVFDPSLIMGSLPEPVALGPGARREFT